MATEVRPPASDTDPASTLLDAYSQAVIRVVERVAPSVVHVRRGRSGGSGVVIAPDGYVLTNAHVVDDVSDVEVVFADGATYRAPIVGTDAATDLAVVRMLGPTRPSVELADSDALRVGQLVIAIGDPLVDTHAKLVGINTAIIAMAQGIAFAIPSATARLVAAALIRDGRVRRAQLGISGAATPIGRQLVAALGLSVDSGIRVLDVSPGSPAQRAGLRQADILVALDGATLSTLSQLQRALSADRVGVPTLLTLIRRGERLVLTIRPDEAR